MEVKELIRKENDIILVPVGSLEQHSRHQPLGTDSFMAIRLAEDAATRSNVIITPPLWYGWSEHYMGYSGTITLKAETLIRATEDICFNLIKHGFRKLLIINGHRITNLSPLTIAAMNIRKGTNAFLSVIDPAIIGATIGKEMRKSEIGGLGHGGELETSDMMRCTLIWWRFRTLLRLYQNMRRISWNWTFTQAGIKSLGLLIWIS